MSLSDAVFEIAQQMEDEIGNCESSEACTHLRSFARQLRSAVRAAQTTPLERSRETVLLQGTEDYRSNVVVPESVLARSREQRDEEAYVSALSPGQRDAYLLAKQQEQVGQRKAQFQEQAGTRMVPLVGGPADGDHAPLDGKAPLGCHVPMGGVVYTLENRDGQVGLYYDEPLTQKLAGQGGGR